MVHSGGVEKNRGRRVVWTPVLWSSVSMDSHSGVCFIKSHKHTPTYAYIHIHAHIFSNLGIFKTTLEMHPVWLSSLKSMSSFLIIKRHHILVNMGVIWTGIWGFSLPGGCDHSTGMYCVYLNAVFFALKAHTEPGQEACTAWLWCGGQQAHVVHQPRGLNCWVSHLAGRTPGDTNL